MEWPSKYGDTTRLLDLFGSDVDVMLRVEGVKKSILIQLLVSDSPSELPLPNQSVKWTVRSFPQYYEYSKYEIFICFNFQPEEYVKWYEEHTELEVLAFLNGLVSSYNSSVISRGQQHYVDHYPRIVKLLQNAF